MTRYRLVLDRKAVGFPITMACQVAGVSRQAFMAGVSSGSAVRAMLSLLSINWWRRCVRFKPSPTAPTAPHHA